MFGSNGQWEEAGFELVCKEARRIVQAVRPDAFDSYSQLMSPRDNDKGSGSAQVQSEAEDKLIRSDAPPEVAASKDPVSSNDPFHPAEMTQRSRNSSAVIAKIFESMVQCRVGGAVADNVSCRAPPTAKCCVTKSPKSVRVYCLWDATHESSAYYR